MMRTLTLLLATLFAAMTAMPAAAQNVTDTTRVQANALGEKYRACLNSRFDAEKPTGNTDFRALTEQVLAACKPVRAAASAELQKLLGPEARPGENAELVEGAFNRIDSAFRGDVRRVADDLIMRPHAGPAFGTPAPVTPNK